LPEAVNLFLSTRLMQRFQEQRDEHVLDAFNKLASILPQPVAQHVHAAVAWLNQKQRDDTRTRIFDLVAAGRAQSRKVRIRYPSSTPRGRSQSITERLISPYFIELNPGGHGRYVIGQDSSIDQIRTFKIERIEHAELTSETFDIPPDFDAADRLRHAWGISDEETVHVRLRFQDTAAAQRVMETNWHPSQRLEFEPDGSVLMNLDVGGLVEISPWLLSWGAAIEVLDRTARRGRSNRRRDGRPLCRSENVTNKLALASCTMGSDHAN